MSRRLLAVAVGLTMWSTSAAAQQLRPDAARRSQITAASSDRTYGAVIVDVATPSRGRLWASLPLSLVGSAAGAFGGFIAGYGLLECADEGPACPGFPDNMEVRLAGLGAALGSTLGAHLGGIRHESRGRWRPALIAAGLTALPALATRDGAAFTVVAAPIATSLVDYYVRARR